MNVFILVYFASEIVFSKVLLHHAAPKFPGLRTTAIKVTSSGSAGPRAYLVPVTFDASDTSECKHGEREMKK